MRDIRIRRKNNNAAQITLEGLKLLEYRGYDSWGIAVKSGKKLDVEKHVGKIGSAALKSSIINHKSSIAIGHTRWATHGGSNCTKCTSSFGLHENYCCCSQWNCRKFRRIKERFDQKGHKFISQTDTEVIVHLIEDFLKKKVLLLLFVTHLICLKV